MSIISKTLLLKIYRKSLTFARISNFFEININLDIDKAIL